MFGLSFVEKASKITAESLSIFFDRDALALNKVSSRVWREPYVLGFVNTLILFQARKLCGPRVHGDVSGDISLRVWRQLTGQQSDGLGPTILQLVTSKNAEFDLGADVAVKLLQIMWGKPDMNDSDTVSLFEHVRSQNVEKLNNPGSHTENGLAALVLWRELFVERLPEFDRRRD